MTTTVSTHDPPLTPRARPGYALVRLYAVARDDITNPLIEVPMIALRAVTPRPPLGAPHPPTTIERRLYAALATLGVPFQRQKELGWYRVDAYLPQQKLAIEADGCAPFHYCETCGYDDLHQLHRQERRDAYLLTECGIQVCHLHGHTLSSDDEALASVRAALAPYLRGAPTP